MKIFIFCLSVFLGQVSFAELHCHSIFSTKNQEHQVADIVTRNGIRPKSSANRYIVKRGMFEYLGQFEALDFKSRRLSLAQELSKLSSNDVVIDFGAGEGVAIEQLAKMTTVEMIEELKWRDFADRMDWRGEIINSTKLPYLLKNYNSQTHVLHSPLSQDSQNLAKYTTSDLDAYLYWLNILSYTEKPFDKRPQFLGITYELTRDPLAIKGARLSYGKLLEDYRPQEIPNYSVGIMYYGVSAYSKNWDQMFSIILSRLNVGGKLFIYGAISEVEYQVFNEQLGSYEVKKLNWGEFFRRYSTGIDVQIDPSSTNNITVTKLSRDIEIPSLQSGKISGEAESPPHFVRRYNGRSLKILSLIDTGAN